VLRFIVLGQVLYIATGPAGLVLAMTGHERLNLLISSVVTVALLIAAPIAAHLFGLKGLAFVTACVPFAGNIANLIAVHRLEKINVVTGRYFGPPVQTNYPTEKDESQLEADVEAKAETESSRDFGAID
jgi:O-antigen/teichoic acid export membrane protein